MVEISQQVYRLQVELDKVSYSHSTRDPIKTISVSREDKQSITKQRKKAE